MNLPQKFDPQKTMSSLEISELTGKQHKNVIRDIEKMLEEIGSDLSQPIESLEDTYKDQQNRSQKCYKLDYELTMILLTGYSIPMRAKVVKRWQELEKSLTQAEYMLLQAQQMVEMERRQKAIEDEQEDHAKRLDQLEAKTQASETDYYSVMGWARLCGNNIDLSAASSLGRKATKLSDQYDYSMGHVKDPRFGTVKTYHTDILSMLMVKAA